MLAPGEIHRSWSTWPGQRAVLQRNVLEFRAQHTNSLIVSIWCWASCCDTRILRPRHATPASTGPGRTRSRRPPAKLSIAPAQGAQLCIWNDRKPGHRGATAVPHAAMCDSDR